MLFHCILDGNSETRCARVKENFLFENSYKFAIAVDQSKCLKKIKSPISLNA